MTKTTDLATQNTGLATPEKKPATPMQAIKSYLTADSVKGRFQEIMGKKAQGFVASILQVVSQSEALQKVDPATIYQSAMMAATLDLPINQNLGFAYIIGYGNKATFQMGYKGYI
ncbi:MAG TPA: recombinase RecT, partial [Candidatus Brocadiaceae bacterium]